MEKSQDKSHLELPIWFMLRSTSRPTIALGTMTGLEVKKADARLLMVVTTGTTTPEKVQLSEKVQLLRDNFFLRCNWSPEPRSLWDGLLTSSQSVFHQLPH